MPCSFRLWTRRAAPVVLTALLVCVGDIGCSTGGSSAFDYFGGTPFTTRRASGDVVTGPGQTGTSAGGIASGSGGFVLPCNEPQTRRFVRISMRNHSADYVHYFLILIAYVNGETHPDGAVCPDDVQLYISNGYIQVAEGAERELGNYCIRGPALYYYHRNGQFRGATGAGSTSLASAIAPAQGTSPTYDAFFTSAGAQLPVPNLLLFHNPGTGEGAALKISRNLIEPCNNQALQTADADCRQDAFYYVDQDDRLVGSTALGFGSGRRVPDEIQGSGCGCGVSNDAWSVLAPSNLVASDVSLSGAYCNAFLRGGRIDFAFVREDTDPPFPQLLWRVSDSSGSRAHDFDSRASIP